MHSDRNIVIDFVRPDLRHAEAKRRAPLASYSLALLMGQTPDEILGAKVVKRVHDEQAKGPYNVSDARPNILCLSYLTTGAYRAYDISAEAMRTRSHDGDAIRVLHGGVHATNLPKEAIQHCHTIVRGEMSPEFQRHVFEQVLTDPEPQKRVLRMAELPQTLSRPVADWSWMNRKDYLLAPSVQTSVGCPFHCDFCSVTEVFGSKMRVVEESCLARELDQHPRGSTVAIVDDNFLQGTQKKHIERCLMVIGMMRERGLKWVAELTVKTLSDVWKKLRQSEPKIDIIQTFAKSGCQGLYFGIESVNEDKKSLSKQCSNQETVELIKACHENGLGVLGAFVIGVSPDETSDDFKRILDFAILEAKIDFAQFSINTPMPGAANFLSAFRDRRIINFDWELYDAEHCVMAHPLMSKETMEQGLQWLYKEFYSYKSALKRYNLMSLLSFNPLLWRRFMLGLSAGPYLHRTAIKWIERLKKGERRQVVETPDHAVVEHVNESLSIDPLNPMPLFSVGSV